MMSTRGDGSVALKQELAELGGQMKLVGYDARVPIVEQRKRSGSVVARDGRMAPGAQGRANASPQTADQMKCLFAMKTIRDYQGQLIRHLRDQQA